MRSFDSFSLGNLFWIQFRNDRISFRIEGLPEDIHFTLAWHKNSHKVNFHITRNIGDGTNKPKIVIAEFDKKIVTELIAFIPYCIINQLYKTMSFKPYSRASRKNIQLIYLDELEKHKNYKQKEDQIINTFKGFSSIKGKRFRVSPDFTNGFIPLLKSPEMRSFLLRNLRPLSSRSFRSVVPRAGILFMGKKALLFTASQGKCYVIREGMSLHNLLSFFMNPDLVTSLSAFTIESIEILKNSNTFSDTKPYNQPYHLFIENKS